MKRKDAKLIKRFISLASVMILSSVLMGQPIANASAATVNSETVDTGISISSPGKTYYLVASGDTVYSIAKHFGETADNIKLWNELDENYYIYPGKILSVDGQNVYSTIDQETTAFTGDKQSFLNHILPIALDTAQTNGLYASVMMAQAMHESNYGTSELAKGSNNLFGIKGSYNGYSLIKKSWETNTDGTIVWSDAAFRLYPTIEDSIRDYGVRLRYGPTVESSSTSWDPDHYAGTWFENADTYLEAIQGLIDGGYATDPVYADKLKEKIAEHNLIQYDEQKAAELSPIQESTDVTLDEGLTETLSQTDTDSILSTKTTKYMAKITGGNMSLDTEPWGITGYQTVANSNDHLGKTVEVIEEKVTSRAIYAKFYLNGQFVWIEKVGLTPETMTNTKEITYTAKVVAGGHSIDSLPWGVEDFTTVAGTSEYLNQLVTVTKETETPRANWVLISQNGKELGWVDKNAVSALGDSMLSTKTTSYMAQITGKNHSLDTLPWGMYGFLTTGSSNDHINEVVEVVEEQVTTRATWAKFKINGQYLWMDKAGLTLDKMTDTRDITYQAKVISGGQTIDSLPKGIYGFQTVANTTDYLNQIVTITKETHTFRGDWVLISQNGKELGWVGKNTVSALGDALLSTKATRYMAQITGINHSLDTLPWGMYGFQTVDSSNDHIGQTVEIVEERVTTRATWAKFYMNGQYVWMDKVGLTPETMTNSKDVNYEATIVAGGHSIDSLPWGVEGFVSIAGTSEYLNQTVTVTKEAQTPRANWALISYNGTILGWVDIKALQPKTQVKPVVFIDPGHGGSDPGAQYSGIREKTINLIISNKVKANLEALGYQVIMSRYTDESVGLLQRSIEANESGADIFVSIHHNAMPANATVTGIETYYYEYDPDYQPVINKEMHNDPTRILESAELASAIQDSLVEYTGALDRGVRRNTFAVLRETAIPAVLLELGYMSSPTELAKLTSTSYQTTLAKAITVGIVAYFN